MTVSLAPVSPFHYCTIENIQDRLSRTGVSLRLDDDPTDDFSPENLYADILEDTATEINSRCYARYAPENLRLSAWIVQRATDIATFLLCERRGNPAPASVARKYDKAMLELEKVETGKKNIYDIVERQQPVPYITNMRIVLRPYPRSVAETNSQRSTGRAAGYKQNTDPADLMGTPDLNYCI